MDQERYEALEVEEARQRVADDLRSVARNVNVVERVRETAKGKIDQTRSMVRERVQGARDALASASIDPVENPIGMMLAGLAVGLLIGLLLPVSRFERERIQPITEDVKQRARSAGNEVMRRGGEVIKETLETTRGMSGSGDRGAELE